MGHFYQDGRWRGSIRPPVAGPPPARRRPITGPIADSAPRLRRHRRARHPGRCPIVLLVITDQDARARRATQTLDQPFDADLAAISPPQPAQSVLAVAPPGTGAGNWV